MLLVFPFGYTSAGLPDQPFTAALPGIHRAGPDSGPIRLVLHKDVTDEGLNGAIAAFQAFFS